MSDEYDAMREALGTLWDEAFNFAEGKRHDGTPWAAHHDRTRTVAVETALEALASPPAPVEQAPEREDKSRG